MCQSWLEVTLTSKQRNHPLFNSVVYSGVVRKSVQTGRSLSQYLCFNITIGSNELISHQAYSEHQTLNYEMIKSLHDSGMGYRKIAKYLNEKGIKTARGNTWVNTQVFSVLKKYRLRLERIKNVRQFNHGEFETRSQDHWNGKGGCPECKKEKIIKTHLGVRRVKVDIEVLKDLRSRGYSISKIAQKMGLSNGTVQRRLREIKKS